MRDHPHLFEANARLLLRRISAKYGRPLTLASIPQEEWEHLADLGFDMVWLMGVWRRSQASRREALRDPALQKSYSLALPDWNEDDVGGSPYAVNDYSLDPALGTEAELSEVKTKLNRLSIRLMLDFVPNHLALDHEWTAIHPQWFVNGSPEQVIARPDWFFSASGGIYLAHGRDPYFPAWTDTVQVNYFSPEAREAMTGELLRVARYCDGVRCDMAMLVLNETFEKVWGDVLPDLPRPQTEFWPDAIRRVRADYPDFTFLAEVYWGLETRLLDMGFNFAYDKTLHDLLRNSGPADVSRYLRQAPIGLQDRLARFIENHDEARAAHGFGRKRSLAAATAISTLPGLRFYHDGQLEGKRVKTPIQLIREPHEHPDEALHSYYLNLLRIASSPVFHEGEWQMLECLPAWAGNASHGNLLAWSWQHAEDLCIAVINLGQHRSQGRVPFSLAEIGRTVTFTDNLTGAAYEYEATEIRKDGIYVDLDEYQSHIMQVSVT